MSINSLFKVIYHFENSNKKQGWDGLQNATVIAANGNEDTIRTVLTNNNIGRPGATIAIDHVSQITCPGGPNNVLS